MTTLQHVAPLGHTFQVNSGTLTPQLAIGAVPAGDLMIAMMVTVDETGVQGETNIHNLVGPAGMVKLRECSQQDDTGGSSLGVTISLWLLEATADVAAGTLLSTSLPASPGYKMVIISADLFSKGGLANTLNIAGVIEDPGLSTENPRSTTLSVGAAAEYFWLGVGAHDRQANATIPTPTNWAAWRPTVSNGGDNFSGLQLWGHGIVNEGDQQTWTYSLATGRRWVHILAAIEVIAPPIPPPPGTPGLREFQADFETPTFGVLGTSTTRRPDAVSLDYQTAFAEGPVAIGDTSEWPQAYKWRARHAVTLTGGEVWIAREGQAEAFLFSYSGAPIDEMDLAFTWDCQPVLVAERTIGGVPEVWLYWYNPTTPGYEFVSLGGGRTPRCVSDNFGTPGGLQCTPDPDVQLVYLKPGTGLVRLEERDDFAVEHPTPINYSSNYYLEEIFPTTDRRISVLYSVHDTVLGTYELRRLDSVPYPIAVLAPHFSPTNVNDIANLRGDLWRNPVPSTTDTLPCVVTFDANDYLAGDVIELQCAGEFPSGFQADPATPNASVGIWSIQNQESVTGTFSLSVLHGNGTCAIAALRARVRRTLLSSDVCYSPWRYFLVPPMLPFVSPNTGIYYCGTAQGVDSPVAEPCQHTILPFGGFVDSLFSSYGLPFNASCPDAPAPCAYVAGGWDPGTGAGLRFDWSYQEYSVWRDLAWSDPLQAIVVPSLLSDPVGGVVSGGGGPLASVWAAHQTPLEIP